LCKIHHISNIVKSSHARETPSDADRHQT
jgi:hypothetical protein